MTDVLDKAATDARTPPVAVWQLLDKLRGDALTEWRVAPVEGLPSAFSGA